MGFQNLIWHWFTCEKRMTCWVEISELRFIMTEIKRKVVVETEENLRIFDKKHSI